MPIMESSLMALTTMAETTTPTSRPGTTLTLLDLPPEITLSWIEMIDDPDDLFRLSRVGNRLLFRVASLQLLKKNQRTLHSALYWASMKGDMDLLHLTLRLGANVNYNFWPEGTWSFVTMETPEGATRYYFQGGPTYRVTSSALSIACRHQHVDIVKALLERGAQVNEIDIPLVEQRPRTPIQWALHSDPSVSVNEETRSRSQILELLLDQGAAVFFETIWSRTSYSDPFEDAMLNDYIPASLLRRMASSPNFFSFDYYYGNFKFAHQDRPGCAFSPNELQKLEFLQDGVVNPQTSGNITSSQLLATVFYEYATPSQIGSLCPEKNEQVVRLALARYMRDSQAEDHYSKSPFVIALELLLREAYRRDIEQEYPIEWISLLHILLKADIDSTHYLDSDEDPELPGWKVFPFEGVGDEDGVEDKQTHVSTPLAYLCLPWHHREDHWDPLKVSVAMHFLLQQGVPVDAQDFFGLTALHFASRFLVIYRLRQLVENGADANIRDKRGMTALHHACIDYEMSSKPLDLSDGRWWIVKKRRPEEIEVKKRFNICRVLLGYGADPTIPDAEGLTPLHYACKFGFVKLIKLFLADPRVDVNAATKTSKLRTPLHTTCMWPPSDFGIVKLRPKDNEETVELLLDAGADAEAKDEDGFTPFHYAQQHHKRWLMDILSDHRRGVRGDDGAEE
ncbi:ankyrin repeat-containing domain protein [Hypoxylon sp. FL1150]|nr:ankyrin repeat-containing domain protein [Hypoxylon sp. FL1150]